MLVDNLKLFLLIVEKGGLSAAGREVGLSPASVTDRLATLEAYYGVRLLARTTRSINLTDEGRELVLGAKRILAEIEELEAKIKLGVEKISGTIHVSAPSDLGRNKLMPLLNRFVSENPEITIDLMLSDGYVDLVRQGVDLALRYGELADSTIRTRRIGSSRRVVCASPHYLKINGTPLHPDDLMHHNCLIMRFGQNTYNRWPFSIDGKLRTLTVSGNHIVNDGDLVRNWCLADCGIALKSEFDIRDNLASGELVAILEDFALPPISLQVVYSDGAVQPRRVRALIDFLTQKFKL